MSLLIVLCSPVILHACFFYFFKYSTHSGFMLSPASENFAGMFLGVFIRLFSHGVLFPCMPGFLCASIIVFEK